MTPRPLHNVFRSMSAVAALAIIGCALMAAAQAVAQVPGDARRFDIPEQPLTGALAQFATISGVDIAYRQSLAVGRRSSAVHGEVPAAVALQSLLRGTGLSARFTGPRAAIVFEPGASEVTAPRRGASTAPSLRLDMAEVRAPIMVGARDRSAHRRYATAVQSEIRELLRSDGGYEGRAFKLEIRIAVDAQGVIREVSVSRPSGEPAWDRHVAAALNGRTLSSPPPSDLTEPLLFEVVSDRLADRTPPRAETRP
jgi:hypothetical protein